MLQSAASPPQRASASGSVTRFPVAGSSVGLQVTPWNLAVVRTASANSSRCDLSFRRLGACTVSLPGDSR